MAVRDVKNYSPFVGIEIAKCGYDADKVDITALCNAMKESKKVKKKEVNNFPYLHTYYHLKAMHKFIHKNVDKFACKSKSKAAKKALKKKGKKKCKKKK